MARFWWWRARKLAQPLAKGADHVVEAVVAVALQHELVIGLVIGCRDDPLAATGIDPPCQTCRLRGSSFGPGLFLPGETEGLGRSEIDLWAAQPAPRAVLRRFGSGGLQPRRPSLRLARSPLLP